jgi:serine/threonine-protein kinase
MAVQDRGGRQLDSWKEIAGYLQRTVRTVQRWERTQGMPVHRHTHGTGASVYAFASELDAWWFGSSPTHRSDRSGTDVTSVKVVVLPFRDLTGAHDHAHFCHGLVEELVTMIGALPGFSAASPTDLSALLARMEADEAVRQAGGQVLVEGSVRALGTHLRVSTRVSRLTDGRLLRSFQLDGLPTQMLALHELVAREVRAALLQPSPGDKPVMRRHSTNVDAYSLYLMSRQLWGQRTPESLRRSVALANRAIALDPQYALAHAGAAVCEVALASYVTEPPGPGMERARAAATRALSLDASVAEGHAALGGVHILYDWDPTSADAAFQQALGANPLHATSWQWHSLVFVATGAMSDAIRSAERAAQLEPTSGAIKAHLSWMYYFAGEYARALAVAEQALAFDPNFARGYGLAGW